MPLSEPNQGPHLVLARKYRPQGFDQLVGQEHVTKTLRSAIASGRIAHAFLFTGIRGVGKTTAARLLAKALNCAKAEGPTPDPCLDRETACTNCIEIADSRSVDVAEIDGASNRGIDSIRELNDNVRYLPAKSRYRVYIIDEAHMVTREGFNALLKTLEEPPPHVKFIFATTAPDKFPDTIISRCQRYDFKRIPLATIVEELRRVGAAEKVTISDAAAFVIAREAAGSLRDAESLLERVMAFSGGAIGDAEVAEVLAVADRKSVLGTAEAVLVRDPKRALEILDGIYEAGRDLERFSRDLLEHWRNLVVTRLYDGRAKLPDVAEEEVPELRRQAGLRSLEELQRIFRVTHEGDTDLKGSEVPRLVLEMTLVRLATLEPALPVDAVLERLDDLAREIGRPGIATRPVVVERPEIRAPRTTAATEPTPEPPRRSTAPAPVSPEAAPTNPSAVSSPAAASPTAAAPRNGDALGRWDEFMEFVRERRISLYLTLSHARAVEHGGSGLVLGVAGEAFRKELASRETLAETEKLAGQFFSAPTKVTIVAVEESAMPAREVSTAATLENPAVRRAVDILGGEVREVRKRG